MRRKWLQTLLLTAASAALLSAGVLGFYKTAYAQQRGTQLPFSNSVEQREAMVRELQEIKGLLREQNTLLRTLVKHATAKDANAIGQHGAPNR